MEPLQLVLLWLFAAAAAYTDLRHRRVPNRLVIAAVTAGTVLAACAGWHALLRGMAGLLLGAALLLPAFVLGMVGGGDVKSLAAIGLLAGPRPLGPSFQGGAAAAGLAAAVLRAGRPRGPRGRAAPRGEGDAAARSAAWTLPYAGILAVCAAILATLS